MNLFDIEALAGVQEIPRITYRPFKVTDSAIYFEKIHALKDQEWTDGIYEYSRLAGDMVRLDSGPWVDNPLLYDVEVPYAYEDILTLQEMRHIYYSVTSGIGEQEIAEFFQLNLEKSVQRSIFSFTYNKNQVVYRGMELLSDDYLLFRVTDAELEDSDFMDRLFLIDVKERRHYEIQDPIFRMTFGQKILIPRSVPMLLVEEHYISEEEQYDLITSRDLELAMEIPDDFHEDNVHRNALHLIAMEEFIKQIKNGVSHLAYQTVDQLFLDGSLRLVGETKDDIYYRKYRYDFVLREKNDFLSRKMMGNEQLMAFNKDTLRSRLVCTMKHPANLYYGGGTIYKIAETETSMEVKNLLTDETLFLYKKNQALYKEELFYGCLEDVLLVELKFHNKPDFHKIKILPRNTKEEMLVSDAFEIGGIVFVITE